MWSVGRYDLHLTDEQFWRLTFKEWAALIKRYNLQYERDCSHAAMVCMVLAEINRDREKKREPFTIEDFMPGKGKRKQTTQEQNTAQMVAMSRHLNRLFGGREKVRKD